MFGAIFSAIAIMAIMVWLDYSFEGPHETKKSFTEIMKGEVIPWAIGFGLAVGAVICLARFLPGAWIYLAPIVMVGLIAMMIYLAVWYASGTSRFWEFLVFLVLEGIVFMALKIAADGTAKLVGNQPFVEALINALTACVSTACSMTGLIALLRFKRVKFGWITFAKVVAIILLIANIISAFSFGFAASKVKVESEDAEQTEVSSRSNSGGNTPGFVEKFFSSAKAEVAGGNGGYAFNLMASPASDALPSQTPITAMDGKSTLTDGDLSGSTWYGFYNLFMLKDNDSTNDYNFGPDPTQSNWKAADYDRDMRERMLVDPALGAADMAWSDVMLGSNISGVQLGKSLEDWMANINLAKEEYMKDQNSYNERLKLFFQMLDTAVSVEVRTYSGVKTQMFMNPYTHNKVPYVVVMELNGNNGGTFLCYTFNLKGTKVELFFRIPCGYQPCNVVESVKAAIEAGGGSSEPVIPIPTVPPTNPPYHKDPTQGTDVGINDTWGPGPDTNNGRDGWYSSAQPIVSSTDEESYHDYRETIDAIADANMGGQRDGGEPNTPTYQPPASTVVDSNADVGTGFGGIDVGTPVVETHIETGGGHDVSISTEEPAGAWGGPPD